MTLRPAQLSDLEFVQGLWVRPENASHLPPPGEGEIEEAIAEGLLFIADAPEGPFGFATIHNWVPRNWSIPALAVTSPGKGQGEMLLRALLVQLFEDRTAHRVALDVTADNHAALRLYAKLGMVREGVWRECWQRPSGEWVDCVLFAILQREWRDLRA